MSDPEATSFAVSLTVGVGSGHDPNALPGLAHYVEHVILQGSAEASHVNGLKRRVAQGGGRINGVTSQHRTQYMFSIDAEQADLALAEFAAMFVKPGFRPEYMEKERYAVDNEWSLNRQRDRRILSEIVGQTIDPAHPRARLSSGNLQTLKDTEHTNLRDAAIAFYQRYYSANIMSLAVVAPHSLTELEPLIEPLFSAIPDRQIPRPRVVKPAVREQDRGIHINYAPHQPMRTLIADFTISNNKAQWRAKPNHYVRQLLSSEAPGGLMASLRHQGWVDGVKINDDPTYYGATGRFQVELALTPLGSESKDAILNALFSYLALIREEGVTEAYYREFSALSKRRFIASDPPSPLVLANALSTRAHDYPPRHLLDGRYLHGRFDPDAIQSLLSQLTPDNLRLWHIEPGVEVDRTIPYFSGRYRVQPMTAPERALWQQSSPLALSLPPLRERRNKATAKPRPVTHAPGSTPAPILLVDSPTAESWLLHSQHDPNGTGTMTVVFNSDLGLSSTENYVLSCLLNDIYIRRLSSLSEQEKQQSTQIEIERTPANSQFFRLTHGTKRHSALAEQLTEHFVQLSPTDEEFAWARHRFERWMKRIQTGDLLTQVQFQFHVATLEAAWTPEQRLEAVGRLTPQSLRQYQRELVKRQRLRVFAFGNYDQAELKTLTARLQQLMPIETPVSAPANQKTVTAEPNKTIHRRWQTDKEGFGFYKAFVVPGSTASTETMAHMLLLNQVFRPALFTQLRTEEQIGYLVQSNPISLGTSAGLGILIHSNHMAPDQINERLDRFNAQFIATLDVLEDGAFQQLKQAALRQLMSKPRGIIAESEPYFRDFLAGSQRFDSHQALLKALQQVSKQSLLEHYRALMLDSQAMTFELLADGQQTRL
ncbi:insulinase family protein [Ferrimonas pelagia]|uniref:insulinase family protein n=1 Tax=Ferrimonas pelagia TaxID=1177826 RepID=UPI0031E7674D